MPTVDCPGPETCPICQKLASKLTVQVKIKDENGNELLWCISSEKYTKLRMLLADEAHLRVQQLLKRHQV